MTSAIESFTDLVSGIDYPMFLVTAVDGEERAGCLVGFVTQASIHPPRLVVMLSKANHTFPVASRAETLGVHFLGRSNRDLAELFGEETGDVSDKFAGIDWFAGPEGTPIVSGARGWVVGTVRSRFDCGDHVAYLLDITHARVETPGAPMDPGAQLGFQALRDLSPGHPA